MDKTPNKHSLAIDDAPAAVAPIVGSPGLPVPEIISPCAGRKSIDRNGSIGDPRVRELFGGRPTRR